MWFPNKQGLSKSSRVFPPQIVLAFGNYMNSSKRGAVYGFRLQSLDLVSGPCP